MKQYLIKRLLIAGLLVIGLWGCDLDTIHDPPDPVWPNCDVVADVEIAEAAWGRLRVSFRIVSDKDVVDVVVWDRIITVSRHYFNCVSVSTSAPYIYVDGCRINLTL